jgi:hypothetical protein
MATLKEIRDQIIIDSGISGQPSFTTIRLNRMINLGQRYVQTNLNGLGAKKWESSDTLTLAAGTFAGSLVLKSNLATDCPNMLESPNSIIFIETQDSLSSVDGIAYEVDVKKFQEQLNNTYLAPTSLNPAFMRLANYIYLAPSSITLATAYYYKAITDLSSDSAITEIPIEFEEFIIKKVVLDIDDILGKLQDKELAQRQLEKDMQATYEKFLGKQAELNRLRTTDKAKLQ